MSLADKRALFSKIQEHCPEDAAKLMEFRAAECAEVFGPGMEYWITVHDPEKLGV